jgi:hypothetical protein
MFRYRKGTSAHDFDIHASPNAALPLLPARPRQDRVSCGIGRITSTAPGSAWLSHDRDGQITECDLLVQLKVKGRKVYLGSSSMAASAKLNDETGNFELID